jgi:hypothetical protein
MPAVYRLTACRCLIHDSLVPPFLSKTSGTTFEFEMGPGDIEDVNGELN